MRSDAPSPTPAPLDFDGNGGLGALTASLFSGAARGDLVAQRELRNICGEAMVRNADAQPCYEITATNAVLMARLCAAHGRAEDLGYLGAILFNAAVGLGPRGQPEIGANYTYEALSIYEQLAVRGDENAALSVSSILGAFPAAEVRAELVERAKLLISRHNEKGD